LKELFGFLVNKYNNGPKEPIVKVTIAQRKKFLFILLASCLSHAKKKKAQI